MHLKIKGFDITTFSPIREEGISNTIFITESVLSKKNPKANKVKEIYLSDKLIVLEKRYDHHYRIRVCIIKRFNATALLLRFQLNFKL